MQNLHGFLPSSAVLADLCGVTERQARRWRRDGLPEYARRLVAIVLDGDLSEVSPAFKGWRIRGDRIEYGADARPSIMADQLGGFDWQQQLTRQYQRELSTLQSQGLNGSQMHALREVLESVVDCQAATARASRLLEKALLVRPENLDAEIEDDDAGKRPSKVVGFRQRDNARDGRVLAGDR